MRALKILPSVLALLALVGWAADVEWLRRLGMSSVTMNPLSATAFLALGSGLLLLDRKESRLVLAGRALILAGGLIGVAKLIDLSVGAHWNFDAMLFASKLSAGYGQPSRIAPNTALCLALESAALLLMTRRQSWIVMTAQSAAIAAGVVAVFAAVGHLYGIDAFYVVGALHPVALPSALALLCLSSVVLVRTASRGLVAPIADRGPAGRTSRSLLPAAFIIPVTLGWLRQQGERAGLFPGDIGVALMVMLTMLSMAALIWQNARWLLAADTLRLKAEAEVAHMAKHDYLTGLPNRAQFMDRLMERMQRRPRPHHWFAVLTMDLDRFKQVNDRLGHGAGDALLCQVALHLNQCLRQHDMVARMGGDEFCMLLDGIAGADEAHAVASRIVSGMPGLFGPEGQQVPVGISVGIVVAAPLYQTPEALLADADLALYRAKHAGKGRFAMHEEGLLF
jgi:diguanylate cyclase (GGDEF)-like protein